MFPAREQPSPLAQLLSGGKVRPRGRALLIQLPPLPNDFLKVFLAVRKRKLQEKLVCLNTQWPLFELQGRVR